MRGFSRQAFFEKICRIETFFLHDLKFTFVVMQLISPFKKGIEKTLEKQFFSGNL